MPCIIKGAISPTHTEVRVFIVFVKIKNKGFLLHKFYEFDVLFFVAVVAADGAELFVYYSEDCLHRLVVGDTLRIVAADNTLQFVWCLYHFLLYYLIPFYDAQHYLWSNNREL